MPTCISMEIYCSRIKDDIWLDDTKTKCENVMSYGETGIIVGDGI